MSENWNATVGEALRLTRGGQLAQATSLLQQGLAGHAAGPQPGVGGRGGPRRSRARSPLPAKQPWSHRPNGELHRAVCTESSS